MSSRNVLRHKSFSFAVRIVKLYKFLTDKHKEYILSKQVLRSGTAIGALSREADQAESKKDFIHKLGVALKETNETLYWLELLCVAEFINKQMFDSLNTDGDELFKILTSSIKTSKRRYVNNKTQ